MAEEVRTKKWSRRWLENAIGLAIVVGTGWVLWQRRASFSDLLDASWTDLGIMGLLVLAGWALSSAQTWVLFRAEGAQIGFGENLVLTSCANFANYLPMRVGTVLRGRYMKHVHGLRYARFGSIFGIRTVLLVSASGLLGAIGTLGLWLSEGRPAWALLVAFVGMALASAVALLVPLPRIPGSDKRLPRIWNDFVDGFAMARARPRVSAIVLALTLLQQLTLGLRLFVGFDAFQTTLSPWLPLLLAALVMLVSFVAITPGGLGLREAAIGYVAFATGGDFSLGLFAGSLDRAVMLVLALVLGAPSFVYIWKKLAGTPGYDGSPTDSRTGSRSRASLR
ncbi:MAG: lysylphosphatidylglycerol synthase transmembrane domain-containing protein [Polyangiales bacterium]